MVWAGVDVRAEAGPFYRDSPPWLHSHGGDFVSMKGFPPPRCTGIEWASAELPGPGVEGA